MRKREIVHCVIYKILNKTNGKFYLGSTKFWYKRQLEHLTPLRQNKHFSKHLQRAWNKYGEENFEFIIAEEVDKPENLLIREQFWLDRTKCYLSEIGYNTKNQAQSMLGFKHSKNTKNKMSESAKNRKVNEETKKKLSKIRSGTGNSFYGKKHTLKTKRLMSSSAKTRNTTEENEKKRREGISKGNSRPVFQYSLDGKFIKEYPSVSMAAEEIKSQVGSIVHAIQGKRVKKHKGFIWKYE